jgi:hypothetical protein
MKPSRALLNLNSTTVERRLPHDILKEEEMQDYAISGEKNGCGFMEWKRCYSCDFFAKSDKNEF